MKRQRQTQQSFISPSSQSVQVILGLCRRVWYRLTAKKSCLISTKSKTTVIFLLRFLFCLYHKMWPGKIQCFKTVPHFKGHCQELWLLPWRLPKDAGWFPARWKKQKTKHTFLLFVHLTNIICVSHVERVWDLFGSQSFYLLDWFAEELRCGEIIPVTVPLLMRGEGNAVQGCLCLSEGPLVICGLCGRTVRDSDHSVDQVFPQPAPVKVMNEDGVL